MIPRLDVDVWGHSDRARLASSDGPTSLLGLGPAPPDREIDIDLAVDAMIPSGLQLLDHAISPPPRRLSDRWILLGLVASLCLHVVIALLLPAGERWYLAAQLDERKRQPEDEYIPPVYLFPYLAHEREEKPATPRAPRSDLSRRAHGGLGAPDTKPGTPGTSLDPILVLPKPAGEPSQGGATVPPSSESEEGRREAPGKEAQARGGGDELVLQLPKQEKGGSSGTLKGLSALGGPGSGRLTIPERRGGQVDLGPLSFDTQWYEWGPYAREMLRRIRYHWIIPEIAQLGVAGVTRVHFFIERNGTVSGAEILWESGHPPMDFAARDAILNASPLPPLPEDLTGVDREGVTITFYYNTKPPEDNY